MTRTALMLNHLHHQTPLPVPNVLAYSAHESDVAVRYILTDLAPGESLESALVPDLELEQRLRVADMMARLIEELIWIKIEGGDGLIGEVCVDNHRHHAECSGWYGHTARNGLSYIHLYRMTMQPRDNQCLSGARPLQARTWRRMKEFYLSRQGESPHLG